MKNAILTLFVVVGLVSVGCHAQVPPTSHSVTLTVTSGPCTAGQSASTCGYVFSKATITGSSCPGTTGSNYVPLNQSAPVPTPTSGNATFTDSSVSGTTDCYIAQTVAGSAVSQPSNTAGPFVVPANPTAPVVNGTEARLIAPSQPDAKELSAWLEREKTTSAQMARIELKAVVR